jgi:hypothetical protein
MPSGSAGLRSVVRRWFLLLAFTLAYAAAGSPWPRPEASGTEEGSCCCCPAGECSCGCPPLPADDPPTPEKPRRPTFCPCGDLLLPMPGPNRVQSERPFELPDRPPSQNAQPVEQSGDADRVNPQSTGPPPEIDLIRTFVLLT